MSELVNTVEKFISDLFGNENIINVISILVVAYTTYRVTKYNISKPNILKIKQLQLESVYLPLFRLLDKMPLNPSTQEIVHYQEEISKILNEHYLLVFPQLHELNENLKVLISLDKSPEKILKHIKHQVSTDYELLKKSLGYPSSNFHDIFIRMTCKQKGEFIMKYVNELWIAGALPVIIVFIEYFQKRWSVSLLYIGMIVIYIFFAVIVFVVGKIVKNMSD